eukprot:GHVQ01006128.1.p1 GENE.GHVQ01006128.1~~GHVQ01006128.1.p1  ORF type:complete len:858 (+),score=221.71 GHVQ01006128.1:722-3295(+)
MSHPLSFARVVSASLSEQQSFTSSVPSSSSSSLLVQSSSSDHSSSVSHHPVRASFYLGPQATVSAADTSSTATIPSCAPAASLVTGGGQLPVSRQFDSMKELPFEITKFDRRNSLEHFYIPVDCPFGKKCGDGKCPLAHTKLEKIFHPIVYKTQPCQFAKVGPKTDADSSTGGGEGDDRSTGNCEYLQKCAFYHNIADKLAAENAWKAWENTWGRWRKRIDQILLEHGKGDKETRRKVDGILKLRMPRTHAAGGYRTEFMTSSSPTTPPSSTLSSVLSGATQVVGGSLRSSVPNSSVSVVLQTAPGLVARPITTGKRASDSATVPGGGGGGQYGIESWRRSRTESHGARKTGERDIDVDVLAQNLNVMMKEQMMGGANLTDTTQIPSYSCSGSFSSSAASPPWLPSQSTLSAHLEDFSGGGGAVGGLIGRGAQQQDDYWARLRQRREVVGVGGGGGGREDEGAVMMNGGEKGCCLQCRSYRAKIYELLFSLEHSQTQVSMLKDALRKTVPPSYTTSSTDICDSQSLSPTSAVYSPSTYTTPTPIDRSPFNQILMPPLGVLEPVDLGNSASATAVYYQQYNNTPMFPSNQQQFIATASFMSSNHVSSLVTGGGEPLTSLSGSTFHMPVDVVGAATASAIGTSQLGGGAGEGATDGGGGDGCGCGGLFLIRSNKHQHHHQGFGTPSTAPTSPCKAGAGRAEEANGWLEAHCEEGVFGLGRAADISSSSSSSLNVSRCWSLESQGDDRTDIGGEGGESMGDDEEPTYLPNMQLLEDNEYDNVQQMRRTSLAVPETFSWEGDEKVVFGPTSGGGGNEGGLLFESLSTSASLGMSPSLASQKIDDDLLFDSDRVMMQEFSVM